MGSPINGFAGERGLVVIADEELSFGNVSLIKDAETPPAYRTIEVINNGDEAAAFLLGLQDNRDVFSFGLDGPFVSRELQPGDSYIQHIFFNPEEALEYTAELCVDVVECENSVRLTGRGVEPSLDIEVEDYRNIEMALGCEFEFPITFRNVGQETLILEDVRLENDAFFSMNEPFNVELSPNESDVRHIVFGPAYEPPNGEGWDTMLTVDHNNTRTSPGTVSIRMYARDREYPTLLDTFAHNPALSMDLLVVVDNTGPLGVNLRSGFTDAVSEKLQTQLGSYNVNSVNVAVLTGGELCPTTTDPFIHVNTSTASASMLHMHLLEGMGGASGAGSQELLQHGIAGLQQECLSGFARPGALLHVLLIAGQDDTSEQAWESQLEALESVADMSAAVMVSTLANPGEEVCGGIDPAPTYRRVVDRTDGADTSVCNIGSWQAAMGSVAYHSAAIAEGGVDLDLGAAVIPRTVSVRIRVPGSSVWTAFDNWALSEDGRRLLIERVDAPPAHTTIEVDAFKSEGCPRLSEEK